MGGGAAGITHADDAVFLHQPRVGGADPVPPGFQNQPRIGVVPMAGRIFERRIPRAPAVGLARRVFPNHIGRVGQVVEDQGLRSRHFQGQGPGPAAAALFFLKTEARLLADLQGPEAFQGRPGGGAEFRLPVRPAGGAVDVLAGPPEGGIGPEPFPDPGNLDGALETIASLDVERPTVVLDLGAHRQRLVGRRRQLRAFGGGRGLGERRHRQGEGGRASPSPDIPEKFRNPHPGFPKWWPRKPILTAFGRPRQPWTNQQAAKNP